MNPIEEKLNALKLVMNNIYSIVIDEVEKEEKWIKAANQEQLREGKKSDGSDMPEYQEDSKAPSAPGKITLFDTGLFHSEIDPDFNRDGINFTNDDEKAVFLVSKYGKEILGLTDENIQELRNRVLPRIRARIASIL